MGKIICANCKFFDSVNGQYGECHRRSPQTVWIDTWPTVANLDWCGEAVVRDDARPPYLLSLIHISEPTRPY